MNRLALKLRFCAAFLLLGLWGADAQTAREQIAAVPERAGGIYHSYEYRPAAATPAPDGYTPVPRRRFPRATNLSTSAITAVTAAAGTLPKASMPGR